MLSVKDIRVAGTGDCGMRRLLPTQAGDKLLASRSLRPRYISPYPPLDSGFRRNHRATFLGSWRCEGRIRE